MATTRQDALADAALDVLATAGLRGLTHRAVDAACGVAEGSTSYYFRSREALVGACVARLVDLDLGELQRMRPTLDRETKSGNMAKALTDLVTGWVWQSLHDQAPRHLARFELLLEARRRPELRAELVSAGERLRAAIASQLAACGVRESEDRARWLVACIDGVLFDSLVGAGGARPIRRAELRQWVGDLVGAVLA